jgi:hypothetical protein
MEGDWITRMARQPAQGSAPAMAYATISLNAGSLIVRPVGKHRWLALKWLVRVNRSEVVSAELGGHLAENGPVGLRCPGTNVPGFYLAGTFWKFWGANRMKSFWIRRHPGKCIRINLRDADFDYLMIEVDDPVADISRINAWVHAAG